ncbi:protein vreteno-like isoform X4 [Eupeodes corollae]|uniref:protein vreteno-like isoform X4 n=1 Tax=Eupeodes corollae TaxID=290404 RepID=UPI002492673E|nr:protein vreteno-like isoform X4 [Eupeodes corollae]
MFSDVELPKVLGFRNQVNNDTPEAPKLTEPTFERGKEPYLVFKNVPANLNLQDVIYLCSDFGKVLRARQLKDFNTYFVNFATLNDMLSVLEGLKTNTLGMTIELGKIVVEKLMEKQQPTEIQSAMERIQPQTVYENHSKEKINNNRLQRINLEKQALLNAGQILQDLNKSLVKGKNPNQVESIKGSVRKTLAGIFSKPSQTYEKAKIGPCEHCSKSCDTVCDRCMSSFCSVECQKAEWNRHRYICGKPASMWPAWAKQLAKQRNPSDNKITEQIESPSSSTSQKDSTRKPALKAQLPPSGNNVILTAISKTNVVFVRSTLYDDNLLFFNTVSRIQKEAKNQSHIQHTPERGDIVLTKFKDQQYNRAMILNPDNLDEIKLIYVDYGNIDSKSLDDLYNAPVEFWNLPRMAVPIILKNVPEFFMTDEVRKYMYSYLNTDLKIVYDTEDLDNGINLSELFDSTSNVSFNETIASFKAGAAEQKKAPVVYREFLQYSPLPTGENVELLVIDSSLLQTGFVSCTTEAYTNEIEKFQKDIQAYVQANETKSTYTPRVNELCLAKYSEDNLWYRGRCIEVVGDGHPTILFFDYGNLSIVSVENIRKYPEEFTFPIMTADCEISGLPSEIGDDLKNDLEELLEPGTKIICEKVEYFEEDNFYSIDLGDLLKKMLP